MLTLLPPRHALRTRKPTDITRGFTIVELLIVVIIIAILASITVMAYSGIQARALNDKMVASVNGSLKLLNMYYVDNGKWPQEAPPGKQAIEYCLGQNYPTAGASGTSLMDSPTINSPRQWCTDWGGSGRAEANWLTTTVAKYGTLPQATALSGNTLYAPIYGVSYPGFVLMWANIAGINYPTVNGATQNGSAHYVYYPLQGTVPDCGNVTNAQSIGTYSGRTYCLVMLEFFGS